MSTGRKLIYILTAAGLLLPFVLITDLYPFFRLGMFAEPVQPHQTQERFEIYYQQDAGFRLLDPNELSINPNNLHYLIRNYYYRNEGAVFLQKLSDLKPTPQTWRIYSYKIASDISEKDSTVLVEWRK